MVNHHLFIIYEFDTTLLLVEFKERNPLLTNIRQLWELGPLVLVQTVQIVP